MTAHISPRMLCLTNKLPYPPMGGATLRNWQNIHNLMNYGSVGILYIYAEHEQPSYLPRKPPGISWWKSHMIHRRPIGQKISRRIQLLRWWVTRSELFPGMYYTPDSVAVLEQALEEFQPNLVIFEELSLYCFLSVVRRFPCSVVYDAHNSETILAHQILYANKSDNGVENLDRKSLSSNFFKSYIRAELIKYFEHDFTQKSNQIWVCSEDDARFFRSITSNSDKVFVIPNGIDVRYYNVVWTMKQSCFNQYLLTANPFNDAEPQNSNSLERNLLKSGSPNFDPKNINLPRINLLNINLANPNSPNTYPNPSNIYFSDQKQAMINASKIDLLHADLSSIPQSAYVLVFVASFGYAPNHMAAHVLLEQVFPNLRTMFPNSHLLLVGAHPTASMLECVQGDSAITITGKVPDVRPYLAAASVAVGPLRQGSGTRLKILEAFAAGCPVVSTSKGAEGLNVIDGVHLLIQDEPREFIEAIASLWRNPALAQSLVQNAFNLVQSSYSWDAINHHTNTAIKALCLTPR